jgi:hypothetical protein
MSVGSATSAFLVSAVATNSALSPIASALANVEEVYRSANEPVKKYLGRNFEVSVSPSASHEQLLEDLKELYTASSDPKKDNIKKRIIVILNLIYPSAPKKEDDIDAMKHLAKVFQAGITQAKANAKKGKTYSLVKAESQLGALFQGTDLQTQAFYRPSSTGESPASLLLASMSKPKDKDLKLDASMEAKNFQRKVSLLLAAYEFGHECIP